MAEIVDPRPWRCVLCSDRFVHEQITQRHETEYDPRPPERLNRIARKHTQRIADAEPRS